MKILPQSDHLSPEQRVLLEQVSHSPSALHSIRRRAQALLLLDDGSPVSRVSQRIDMDRRAVHSLLMRHHRSGVYAALLGARSTLQRRCWLALSPMRAG
jgi:Homeodomain-like domain-containing protein